MANGLLNEGVILKGLFGDDIFKKAYTNQSTVVEELRKNKSLGANRSTGILSSISAAGSTVIKPNTFFGE